MLHKTSPGAVYPFPASAKGMCDGYTTTPSRVRVFCLNCFDWDRDPALSLRSIIVAPPCNAVGVCSAAPPLGATHDIYLSGAWAIRSRPSPSNTYRSTRAVTMADPSLPAYADPPHAAAPTDHKPAPQSIWIQDTDTSGTYRKRYILPAAAADDPPPPPPFDPSRPPPTYSSSPQPLYTVKSHGRAPLDFRGPQPDITIYLGDGDSGPVVATGVLHTTPLKRSLGEVRFFPRPRSSTPHASSAKDIPAITIRDRDAGKTYTFTHHAHTFTWVQTGRGERPPTPTPPPAATATAAAPPPSLLSKLGLRSAPKAAPAPTPPPPLARDTKTWELHAADATRLATYTELQPVLTGPAYRASAPAFSGGHMARVDVHEPAFDVPGGDGGVRELAVVSVVMMVEAQRRRIANAANRGWLGSVQGGAVGGGCGGV